MLDAGCWIMDTGRCYSAIGSVVSHKVFFHAAGAERKGFFKSRCLLTCAGVYNFAKFVHDAALPSAGENPIGVFVFFN